MEAISYKEGLDGSKSTIEKTIRKNRAELEKLNAGKTTIKSIFKSSSGKAESISKLTQYISQGERDIENFDKIITVLTIYLSEKAIPEFKKKKTDSYFAAVKVYCEQEISNTGHVSSNLANIVKHLGGNSGLY
jgi:hypothetical protein